MTVQNTFTTVRAVDVVTMNGVERVELQIRALKKVTSSTHLQQCLDMGHSKVCSVGSLQHQGPSSSCCITSLLTSSSYQGHWKFLITPNTISSHKTPEVGEKGSREERSSSYVALSFIREEGEKSSHKTSACFLELMSFTARFTRHVHFLTKHKDKSLPWRSEQVIIYTLGLDTAAPQKWSFW